MVRRYGHTLVMYGSGKIKSPVFSIIKGNLHLGFSKNLRIIVRGPLTRQIWDIEGKKRYISKQKDKRVLDD